MLPVTSSIQSDILHMYLRAVDVFNNRIASNYHYTISSTSYLLFYLINFYFSIFIMFSLLPSDANDPQGLMRR